MKKPIHLVLTFLLASFAVLDAAEKSRTSDKADFVRLAAETRAASPQRVTILRNVTVTGYHTGIVVYEHTDGESINLNSNINGLEFAMTGHASRFGRVLAQRCTYPVAVTGRHAFSIQQLDIERAGPTQTDANTAWQVTECDVNDPNNRGIADITYWVTIGNVGARDVFTKNGGASIQARRIGSAPVGNERTGK